MGKTANPMKHKFSVVVIYSDRSSFDFSIEIEGEEFEWKSTLMMVTRGTLQASNARTAIAYNEEGIDVVSYTK